VLIARLGSVGTTASFADDVDLALDPEPVTASATAVEGGYLVEVTARSYVRDVALLADRLAPDAVADDALVDLVAGESASILVTTQADGLEDGLTRFPILRTANDLRRRR